MLPTWRAGRAVAPRWSGCPPAWRPPASPPAPRAPAALSPAQPCAAPPRPPAGAPAAAAWPPPPGPPAAEVQPGDADRLAPHILLLRQDFRSTIVNTRGPSGKLISS